MTRKSCGKLLLFWSGGEAALMIFLAPLGTGLTSATVLHGLVSLALFAWGWSMDKTP